MTREEAINKMNEAINNFLKGHCKPEDAGRDAHLWKSGAMFAIDLFTKET